MVFFIVGKHLALREYQQGCFRGGRIVSLRLGLLQEAEKALSMFLADKHVGGYAGGGAILTADGKRLLYEYKEYRRAADRHLDRFADKVGLVRQKPAQTISSAVKPRG